MLIRGVRKLERRGVAARSGLACGDGEALPLASETQDAALVAFGIRHVGGPAGGPRGLRRTLRRGGRLVVLEFSMPRGAMGKLYRLYFGRVLPFVGGLLSGDRGAYSYLPASVERFPSPSDFAALMGRCGFPDVRATALTGGIAYIYRGEANA